MPYLTFLEDIKAFGKDPSPDQHAESARNINSVFHPTLQATFLQLATKEAANV